MADVESPADRASHFASRVREECTSTVKFIADPVKAYLLVREGEDDQDALYLDDVPSFCTEEGVIDSWAHAVDWTTT